MSMGGAARRRADCPRPRRRSGRARLVECRRRRAGSATMARLSSRVEGGSSGCASLPRPGAQSGRSRGAPGGSGREAGRRVVDRLEEVLDQVEERRLRPVDVVDESTTGALGREPLEQPSQRPEELLDRERRRREPDRGSKPVGDDFTSVVGERAELRQCLVGVVLVDDSRLGADRLGERPESDAVAVGEAAPGEHGRARRPTRARNSVVSRDLPTPASPTGSRGAASERSIASSMVVEERSSSVVAADEGRVASPRPLGGSRTRTRRYAGTGSDFPFSASGSTSSTSTASRTSRYVSAPIRTSLLAGRLLEPGGDVHGVAGDEPLAGRRVAGHDLARVHAGAVREPDAPVRARARRSARRAPSACPRPRGRREARRPRGASAARRRPSRRRR